MRRADKLANKFNSNSPTALKQKKLPCSLPGYVFRLRYDGSTITNKLHSTMSKALHQPKTSLLSESKNDWTDLNFNSIHWNVHEHAFKKQMKTNQVMIAKIIHKLVSTNIQKQIFCGKSPVCPSPQSSDETIQHILSCTSPEPTESRRVALLTLQADLAFINTPTAVIEAITHGITMWINNQGLTHHPINAPTVGSTRGPDILLTMAFTEQYHSIGW
jgi:hypothetical protein